MRFQITLLPFLLQFRLIYYSTQHTRTTHTLARTMKQFNLDYLYVVVHVCECVGNEAPNECKTNKQKK